MNLEFCLSCWLFSTLKGGSGEGSSRRKQEEREQIQNLSFYPFFLLLLASSSSSVVLYFLLMSSSSSSDTCRLPLLFSQFELSLQFCLLQQVWKRFGLRVRGTISLLEIIAAAVCESMEWDPLGDKHGCSIVTFFKHWWCHQHLR